MILRKPLTLALVATALASVRCAAEDLFTLRSREAAADLYLYVGAERATSPANIDTVTAPIEARVIMPRNLEFAVEVAATHALDGAFHDIERGDTTFSFLKGWRMNRDADFLSFEMGYVAAAESDDLSSGVRSFARARIQFGPTLRGFDISLGVADRHRGFADTRTAWIGSAGYRGQYGRAHFGFDILATAQDQSKSAFAGDLVYMWQRANGDGVYGRIARGLSGSTEKWSGGIGYEFRLGLKPR